MLDCISPAKTGKIWYLTLKKELSPDANFQQSAEATIRIAGQIYGSDEQKAVSNAWQEVGGFEMCYAALIRSTLDVASQDIASH